MKQNDQFVLQKGDNTAFVWMDVIKIGLQNCPSQIYNVDETGVPLNPIPRKIVVAKGMKKPCYHSPGQNGQITVVSCGNAAGNVLPF